MTAPELASDIADFLRSIGLDVRAAQLAPEDCFLPGVRLDHGRVLYHEPALTWPGDLLHEAGHVAVAPPETRPLLTGAAEVPGLDMGRLEHAAVAWSYAAALAVGIDPALVFHEGGYRGRSDGILATFAVGVYPGANLLEEAGMTATGSRAEALGVAPYPHMIGWLREG
jgi:hypothetical protein